MGAIDQKIEKLLKRVPQYTRAKRHAMSLLSHSTPKKLMNLFVVEAQRKLHRTKVAGYPYLLIADTGNICNLRCSICPTGSDLGNRKKSFLKFEEFKKIIDCLCPYLFEVTLHNWGEPLLNPDIYEMARYCKDKNIGTNLSTNFNISNFDAEALINSGVEYLVISLDGTTQDIYSKYRVGGDIGLVFKNIKKLVGKKKELKSKQPFIEWQYIVMKHNVCQADEAEKMAGELGVDLLRFIPVGLVFDTGDKNEFAQEWFPYLPKGDGYRDDAFLQKPIRGGCFYLYRAITVNPDGAVAPCCAVYNTEDDFGNILEEDFSNIWNNQLYQNARALFSTRKQSLIKTVCQRCGMFVKS